MKVCAHINHGPCNSHARYDSIYDAVVAFRDNQWQLGQLGADTADATMDLYPQCGQCTWRMNFHDYPMARYELGPRGGVRKVIV